MDSLNSQVYEDRFTYSPKGISEREFKLFESSGYWSAQIYWRDDGFPHMLREFYRIPPGEVLTIFPVGTHSSYEAVRFINARIADVYHYVMSWDKAKGTVPLFDMRQWKLGSPPGSPPTNPGSSVTSTLRRAG